MNTSEKLDPSKLLGYRLQAECEKRRGSVGSSSSFESAKLGVKAGGKIGEKVPEAIAAAPPLSSVQEGTTKLSA